MARKTDKKANVQNTNNEAQQDVNANAGAQNENTDANAGSEQTVNPETNSDATAENNAPVTKTLQDVVDAQTTTRRPRNGNYVEYSSKKKLFEANILSDEMKATVEQLKNTFSFSAHKDNTYLIITLYVREDKTYKFLIVNMATQEVETADSIKLAKARVAELTGVQNPEVA